METSSASERVGRERSASLVSFLGLRDDLDEKFQSSIHQVERWVGLVPDIFNSMARDLNFTFTLALSRLVL